MPLRSQLGRLPRTVLSLWAIVCLWVVPGCHWQNLSSSASTPSTNVVEVAAGYPPVAAEGLAATSVTPAWNFATRASPGQQAKQFFALADDARRNGDSRSPDYYYQAAISAWYCLRGDPSGALSRADALQLYHASVTGFVAEGQRFGRLNGCGQMIVYEPGRTLFVPLVGVGLPWQSTEISALHVGAWPAQSKLTHYYASDGFGVPAVATRSTGSYPRPYEKFLPPNVPFAVTVVLRPAEGGQPSDRSVLEVYNPLTVQTVPVQGQSVGLARDVTAPLAYRLQTNNSTWALGFLDPSTVAQGDGLRFLEPYQPGKIPVIFVHGLLSDSGTWADVVNDLRSQAWFNERYQIWGFSYGTGAPFITSAMLLREQCKEAVAMLDPQGSDPALRQIVLVGHSMGGLVSKLQVTYSEDRIWNSFSKVPLECLVATPEVKAQLAQRCFFDPQPCVRRVVFIATPHEGSAWAARGIGKMASLLVEPSPEHEAIHGRLVADNPGVFTPQFEERIPTSIDMLKSEDPTLEAIRGLRVSPCVKFHSIVGTGRPMLLDGPGDGVVTVPSARYPGVVSERFVEATHLGILRNPDTQAEIERILCEHLQECGR